MVYLYHDQAAGPDSMGRGEVMFVIGQKPYAGERPTHYYCHEVTLPTLEAAREYIKDMCPAAKKSIDGQPDLPTIEIWYANG